MKLTLERQIKMNFFKRLIGHLKTVFRHKKEVAKICFKFGLYWQGIIHDLSKFSPTEFIPSVKYNTTIAPPQIKWIMAKPPLNTP